MLTTGAMTNRIDRLEERSLVERKPDPEDRRGLYIRLTRKGLDLIDRAIEIRAGDAANIVSNLTETDRVELANLLRTLVIEAQN